MALGGNISRSSGGELKRRGAKLEDGPLTSKPCRLSRDQLCVVRNNSLHFGLSTPPGRPVRGRSAHRSACARAACTIHETNRAHRTHPGPALMSGSSMHLDVLPCGGRPHSCLRGAADGAAGQLGALAVDLRRPIRVALVHRANLLTTAARQDAKRPVWSKP